jgi:transcriptional regulator with XRE-family HTH domain
MNRYERIEQSVRDRIVAARRAAGLSQEALGDALGLSKAGYGHYERGAVAFGVRQLFQLSDLLHRSVAWFLGLETGLTEEEDRLLALFRQIKSPFFREKAIEAVSLHVEMDGQVREQ